MEKVSHLMGLHGGEASQEETRLLAARCLAEQAYVYPYDVELDDQDELRERLTAALSLYNRALDYGGQLVRRNDTLLFDECTFFELARRVKVTPLTLLSQQSYQCGTEMS